VRYLTAGIIDYSLEFGSFSCDEGVELEAVWLVLRLMLK